MSGDAHQRDGDYVLVRNGTGGLVQALFLNYGELRKRSLALSDALTTRPNTRARFEARHLCAGLRNRAGKVATDDVRKCEFHWDHTCADVDIDGVHVHGSDFDEAFFGARLWCGQVAVDDDLRRTCLIDISGFHRFLCPGCRAI